MRKIQLVKGSTDDDQPRKSPGGLTTGERRYRYPAEEIWEVSEERWDSRDTPRLRQKAVIAN